MSRTKWILTITGVVIVALVLWRILSSHGGTAQAGPGAGTPVPVTMVPAALQNVPTYLMNHGTVTPINTVNVQPQVGGELMKLDFTEGDPVKQGQVIAQIDPRTLQGELDQATGKLQQDEAQLETAKANLERSSNPKYAPYVAQIDRITQRNKVLQYQAAVAADNGSIRDVRVQLGFTSITSPIDGVAGIRQVTPGNVVTTGSTIVTITQMHPIDVLFTLPGKYLDEVRSAQAKGPLSVVILNASGGVIEGDGVLKVINNQIDQNTDSCQLKAEFPNSDNKLFPGQYANVRLELGVQTGVLVVPAAAVQRGPDGDYVWLVTSKKPAGRALAGGGVRHIGTAAKGDHQRAQYVTMQVVTTGGEAGDTGQIITKGLKSGYVVVATGQFRLKEGSRVTPMEPGEASALPASIEAKTPQKRNGAREQ
ncbi:MAG: efflux RND transporter periplasmic adaptor subunit [Rhodanobacteraceae bacterium]|nr:MAG: efflux RND transporter periplasmic adaptor subunit [Rhodanobacteraceae bacterium]